MENRYTAYDIAVWFLSRNKLEMADSGADFISNLKLQKLLYYAQGVYLAIKGHVLFNDDILAWKHGPVVESVYHEFKNFGSNGIDSFDCKNYRQPDQETSCILEDVYDTFGQFSAWKLRNMTHEERPWKETPQNEVISPDLIKEYFLEEYIE